VSTTTSNSQQVTLTANTEAHLTWSVYYEAIQVANLGSSPVWLTTDGTAATASETGADCCPANSTIVVANRQPKLKAISSASGSTAQVLTAPSSGSLTYVSLISTGTPQVVVSPC
jgi:hypothetical protein